MKSYEWNPLFFSKVLFFHTYSECWAPWGSKSGFPRNLEEVWDLQPQNPSLVHPSLLHHHQTLIFHLHPTAPLFHIEADHQHPGSDQLFQLQSQFKGESDQYQDLRNFYIQQSSLSPQVSVFLWVSGSSFVLLLPDPEFEKKANLAIGLQSEDPLRRYPISKDPTICSRVSSNWSNERYHC